MNPVLQPEKCSLSWNDLRCRGGVAERAAPLVSKKSPGLAHEVVIENVHEAVVVVVLGIGAHCRDGRTILVIGHPKFQSHFFESTVFLIQKEEIPFGIVG